MLQKTIDTHCSYTVFGEPESTSEYYILISSERNSDFSDVLRSAISRIKASYEVCGLSKDTQVFSRFFFSDIANQKDQFYSSELYEQFEDSAYSLIQQPPLSGGDLTILLYHIQKPTPFTKKHQSADGIQNTVSVEGSNYDLHFSCNYHDENLFDSNIQTTNIFTNYIDFLSQNSMTLGDNTIRTWLFVNCIDCHYGGLVESRREIFDQWGLTADTHFIASTGIEGRSLGSDMLVTMDALSISNLESGQVTFLHAPDYLNPTSEYGVTFERGTKVEFGDRAHFHISGTASIDKHGQVVHETNIRKQTERTVENINALLAPSGISIHNMVYLIVYIRNMNHYPYVKEVLDEIVDHDVLKIYVQGSVCRQSWLVEIEGVGIASCSTDFNDFF